MKTQAQLIKRFGDPSVDQAAFEREHMTVWNVPREIDLAIGPIPARMYCNRLMIDPLERTLRELIRRELHHEIRTYDGIFNVRKKRGLSTLSMHAFGLAIDLNAAWNPLGGRVTWSPEFLAVWRKQGWTCGADWAKRPDGMHFQWDKF
ncbi:hypothetical protein F5984_20460 [Rudanella paleaurantiibacter]|uniref:Peptidase M15C domain-containing protein n=1 Tax=Rudanella paleaurantiibacter TaxID=2614655 RepID=A0A7J5TVE8_9BACT|nr:M15 family metallopeptidase [Rudanella paleaurantiibacter]KAB7728121.1 hypothetical protein F5984_20460 [Rudanella paleaurantiibacter]